MIQIPAMTERCAGIDVGKRGVAVATAVGPVDKEAVIETRWYGTTVPALRQLDAWLREVGCTTVAMESTGSYWIPVKNILEGSVKITLVCAHKHRPKKGQKTDFRDAIDLATKHRHGLLSGSYMPERGIVELRDFTRRRRKLCGVLGSEKNRIQKVLETANVKFGSVASDVFGVSGQKILQALLENRPMTAAELAQLACHKLRNKIPELTEALEQHQLNDHHRWLIRQSIEHAAFLDRQIEALETKIDEHLGPYRKQYELLMSIPGVKQRAAANILAEIGPDLAPFRSAGDLSSWAGICPGNNRSAGKSKSSHIKRANQFLMAALVESAWGAARARGSNFYRQFQRWAKGPGTRKKAAVAVAHSVLRVVYAVLKNGEPYRETDAVATVARERVYRVRHHARLLVQMGADPATVTALVEQMLACGAVKEAVDAGPASTASSPAAGPAAPEQSAKDDIEHPQGADANVRAAEPAEEPTGAKEQEPPPPNQSAHPELARTRSCRRVARGVLGFRIRAAATLKDEYSVFKDPPGTTPSPAQPATKQKHKKTRHKDSLNTDVPG